MTLGTTVWYRGRQHVVVGRCFKPPEKPADMQYGQELFDLADTETDKLTLYVEAEAVSKVPTTLVVA